MFRKIVPFVLLVIVALSGCRMNSDDPSNVLKDFFVALMKGNFNKARELATPNSTTMIDMMELAAKTDPNETGLYDLRRMEIGDAVISGDNATVPVVERQNGEVMNFSLRKMPAGWKVVFEKDVLDQMVGDKIKSSSGTNADPALIEEIFVDSTSADTLQ